MTGRIKLYRSSQDNGLYFSEPFTRWQARQDMILIANHANGNIVVRGNIIELKRGQLGHSEETLSKRWKWSRNKVRRYLNHLETIQQIEQQKSKVKSIITIINYNKYQGNDTTDDTTEGHQTIQQTDTNKKNKKKQNDKNIEYSPFFNKLWLSFPHARIGNKKESYENMKNGKLTEEQIEAELKLLLRKIEMGLQDMNFLPACQRWIKELTPTNPIVKEKILKDICKKLKENKLPNRIDQGNRLNADFGEELIARYWKEIREPTVLKFGNDTYKI